MSFSWTTVLTVVFTAYIMNSVYTIYKLYSIPPCTEGRCIDSYLLKEKADFWLFMYSSPSPDLHEYTRMKEILVWDDFNCTIAQEKTINVTIPRQLRKNGTAYVHIFLVPKGGEQPTLQTLIHRADITFATGSLSEYAVPEATAFNLLGSEEKESQSAQKKPSDNRPVTHWRSRIVVEVVTDTVRLSAQEMPRELIRHISVTPKGNYLPTVRVDTLNYRLRDLLPVNKTSDKMPLQIVYNPISFGKLRLWIQLEQAMTTMASFGFTPKDIDEVKGIFTDINMYLLCMTFVVAAFHLLFDFLAFKNDISFWRQKQDMVGLSSRTLIWRCVSQSIVFLYLMDENTSLLVLVPSGIGTIIEMWKVTRAFRITISWDERIPRFKFGETSVEEKTTQEYDAEVMKYLSYLLYPLCIIGAIYSLFYMPHKSWYSWCIHSLVNGVYAFGFLFMLPQLFVNYKLKSVAHLPWRAFMYKAFNTFIDDIFAFIITMPTAHRVACFRDDVVFLVYLYQRWLYPVDKRRVNEFGQSYTDENSKSKED